ncbi:MAG: dihydrolipoamide acetyltransferase family protein [Tepidisphaeraceae bacterium]
MVTNVFLPQVELTMESATIAKWLVAVGDHVAAEQALLEVETQKATTDVPSPAAGYVRKLCVEEGETVNARALLCVLSDDLEERLDNPSQAMQVNASPATAIALTPSARAAAQPVQVKASPAARRLAKELGVDLSAVTGSGPDGRVTEHDVQSNAAPPAPAGAQPSEGWTTLPRTRMALIAQMQRSVTEIPQIHLRRQVDVARLSVSAGGVTFTHRLIVATAAALRKHPALRTTINGDKVKVLPVNVAVAINSPHGLVAPVIRNADELSLPQVSSVVKDFRERAEANVLRRDELIGDAPFAISNLGMFEIDQFDALVFYGQTAVLSVGKSTDGPGGCKLAWMGLAVDHRVVDGAEAARFLQTLQAEILRP